MELKIEQGCFSYQKTARILNNIQLEVGAGQLLAVLGPNGAGKTTLLRCMMGFLPWDQGGSYLDGKNITQIPKKILWQTLAYVPQRKDAAQPLSVFDMILLGCTSKIQIFSKPGKKEYQQVEQVAESLGITCLLDQRCNEISGGELQLVLIARALAAEPKILILDEPESNLDFKNQLIVLDTMSKLVKKGMCCIFNTHDPSHALMRATHGLLLYKNGEAVFGKIEEVVTADQIRKAFGVDVLIEESMIQGQCYKSILPMGIAKEEEKTWEVSSCLKS